MNLIFFLIKKASGVSIICIKMWLKIKNLGKYINNLQKEWVISTMLLSCTYIEMKCVFYVNTLGLLSLKWIKNEPNIMHVTSNE